MFYIVFSKKSFKNTFLLLVFTAILAGFGCSSEFEPEEKQVPLARVFDVYLYQDELRGVIPAGISPEDSTITANNYIDLWIKKQLMLKKADLNLTPEQKNFDKQLDDYKQKLLMYTYSQLFVEQKLDTNVSFEEIKTYYNENLQGFLLNREVVRASIAKIPITAPNLSVATTYIRSASPIDSASLINFCNESNGSFTNYNGEFVNFSEVLDIIPINIKDIETFLHQNKTIEVQDENYKYLARIYDAAFKGQPEPLESIKTHIKEILLTKKKKQLLDELELNLFNDAFNHKNIEYYTY